MGNFKFGILGFPLRFTDFVIHCDLGNYFISIRNSLLLCVLLLFVAACVSFFQLLLIYSLSASFLFLFYFSVCLSLFFLVCFVCFVKLIFFFFGGGGDGVI